MSNASLTAVLPRNLAHRDRQPDRATEAALADFRSPTEAVIHEPLPASARATVWVIAASAAAAITAMALCPVDRVVTAPGKLVSEAPTLVVQPLETSIVRSIDVREGQTVHRGEVLARLDPTVADADAAASEAQVASLAAEVARLRAETAGVPYVSDGTPAGQLQEMNFIQRHAEQNAKLATYRQKIDAARARVAQAEAQIAGYAQQLRAASATDAIRRALERMQVGSKLARLEADAQRAGLQRALDAAVAGRAEATDDLAALQRERDATAAQFRREALQQLTEQQRRLADAREQRSKAELRRRLVDLRADRDAVVLSVAHVSVGSVLQSGDTFITLVPRGAPLEVETSIAGREAGFVQPGDRAVVKFDTFPYATYGYDIGAVRTISPDSFADPRDAPQRPGRPDTVQVAAIKESAFYRARIALSGSKLHDLPHGFRPVPGMPVTVDINVGRRTVLGYLTAKVIPVLSEGLREP